MATRSPHKTKKAAKDFKNTSGPVGGMIRPGAALPNVARRGLKRIPTTFADTPKIHTLKAKLLRLDPEKTNLPTMLKRLKRIVGDLEKTQKGK